jgi:homotetrameric cytidine deaminase
MVPADQNTSHSNGPLDAALESLLGLARQAALHSYAPYSGFRVGAALRLTNGETVTGTNVENVSYGLTICAERAALVQAVSEFGPQIRVEAEFILPEAPVVFPAAGGMRVMPFSALMPLAFEMKLK